MQEFEANAAPLNLRQIVDDPICILTCDDDEPRLPSIEEVEAAYKRAKHKQLCEQSSVNGQTTPRETTPAVESATMYVFLNTSRRFMPFARYRLRKLPDLPNFADKTADQIGMRKCDHRDFTLQCLLSGRPPIKLRIKITKPIQVVL